MSTYIVAFVVGKLKHVETVIERISKESNPKKVKLEESIPMEYMHMMLMSSEADFL